MLSEKKSRTQKGTRGKISFTGSSKQGNCGGGNRSSVVSGGGTLGPPWATG